MDDQARSTRARATLSQPNDTAAEQIGAASRARRIAQQASGGSRQMTERQPSQEASGVWGQVKQQAATRPWTTLGVSMAAGYALGSLSGSSSSGGSADRSYTSKRQSQAPEIRSYSGQQYNQQFAPDTAGAPSAASESAYLNRPANSAAPARSPEPGLADKLMGQFGDELSTLKEAALSSILTLVRDTIKQNVPQLHQELERVRQEHGLSSSPSSQITRPSELPAASSTSEQRLNERTFGSRTDM